MSWDLPECRALIRHGQNIQPANEDPKGPKTKECYYVDLQGFERDCGIQFKEILMRHFGNVS